MNFLRNVVIWNVYFMALCVCVFVCILGSASVLLAVCLCLFGSDRKSVV